MIESLDDGLQDAYIYLLERHDDPEEASVPERCVGCRDTGVRAMQLLGRWARGDFPFTELIYNIH